MNTRETFETAKMKCGKLPKTCTSADSAEVKKQNNLVHDRKTSCISFGQIELRVDSKQIFVSWRKG